VIFYSDFCFTSFFVIGFLGGVFLVGGGGELWFALFLGPGLIFSHLLFFIDSNTSIMS